MNEVARLNQPLGLIQQVISERSSRNEYLTFRIGQQEYGISILDVQEIRSYEVPTRMPGARNSQLGVLNLRGVIVPITDGRIKLGVRAEYGRLTVMIILCLDGRTVGLVVDLVSDVHTLSPEEIKLPPVVQNKLDESWVAGLGTILENQRERLLILLDSHQFMLMVH
jgi:purine-binding chemotaxis protein CheW